MTWTVNDTTTKNNMLTQINNALGTSAKISWQTAGNVELATTTLNAAGVPFSTPSSGSMTLVTPPYTSTVFSAGGCTQAKFQTSGSTTIYTGTVSTSGADINVDAVPVNGQTLRLDSLSHGIV